MRNQVVGQVRLCDKGLSALPYEVPSDPVLCVITLVGAFAQAVGEHVRGSTTHAALVQRNNSAYAELHTEIALTAPVFVPFDLTRDTIHEMSLFVPAGHTGDIMELAAVRAHIAAYVAPVLYESFCACSLSL